MLTVHPLYGVIPNPYISQEDISQDVDFETLLEHLKKPAQLLEGQLNWEIDFFVDKFLTSKENTREILKAYQEGFYKNKNSSNYTIQEDPKKVHRHMSDFANRMISLEKAYSGSISRIRRSAKNRLTIEKANFLREAFEELAKEETNSYIKVVNDIYRMLPIWQG